MNKPHLEFHQLDLTTGWASPPGFESAPIQQRILSSNIDEKKKSGGRTRLLRYDPGGFLPQAFVHDYWEEVYLLSGDLIVGGDAQGNGGDKFLAPTYCCRPPGVPHGPFKSAKGCIVLEIHYYDEKQNP